MSERLKLLSRHLEELRACARCPAMHKPVVLGRAVDTRVMLVGQAPGDREPKLGRPFAWTAGKNLFRWFESKCGINEETFRSSIYIAAVGRCFPGKKPTGGDRVPTPEEIANCQPWLRREVEILQPHLIIPVGKLAIEQFIPCKRLDTIIGQQISSEVFGHPVDLIPLPHPSGASTWHFREPGKTLLANALERIAAHPAFQEYCLGQKELPETVTASK